MKTNWMKSTIHQYPYRVIVFIIAYIFLWTGTAFSNETKSIKIVDEQGDMIQSFRCMARWKEFDENNRVTGSITWKKIKTKAGITELDITELIKSSEKFTNRKPANGLELFLMADGYAPESIRCRFENIPDEIVLEKPVTVYLEKKNETVSGEPAIVPKAHVAELLYQPSGSFPLKVKKVNPNKWECQLKKGQSYVIGWKTGKGGWFSKSLEGYCSKPFTAEQDGQVVNFEPGMPITFEYDLSGVPQFLNINKYPVKVWLYRTVPGFDDERFWFSNKIPIETKKARVVKIPGLAAGTYYLTAYNSPPSSHVPQLSDRRKITLSSGAYRFEPRYPLLDDAVEPGDVTIKGTVLDAEKKPMAKEQITLWLQQYDEKKRLKPVSDTFYKPVKTNAQGKFEFKGVLPDQDVVLSLSNHSNSIFLARNSLKENAEIEVSFIVGQKNKLITVGKPFPFPMVHLENDDKKDLDELKGKIVVIDIWASWCTPCIRSMPKLCELAKEMQSEEVKFITLSIDSDKQAWIKRLAENDWPVLLHTWFDGTINNHKLKYNGGIPFCVIIDEQGMVRVAGNGVDIKSELEKL